MNTSACSGTRLVACVAKAKEKRERDIKTEFPFLYSPIPSPFFPPFPFLSTPATQAKMKAQEMEQSLPYSQPALMLASLVTN